MLGAVEGDVVVIGTSLAEVAWQVVERLLAAGGELLTLVRGLELMMTCCLVSRPGFRTVPRCRCRGVGRRTAALPAAARSWNDHLRLVGSPWRTDTFRRLATRLENVIGSKTAKQFEPLKIFTVGDLMRHVPRRYFSGTELSDLSHSRKVRKSRSWRRSWMPVRSISPIARLSPAE